MNRKITPNFRELEFEVTSTGITNKLPKMYEINRYVLASQLQRLRDLVGKPIQINSAYRSYEVNKAVGGANQSRHLYCLAADIVCPSVPLHKLLGLILSDNIGFSKILVEPTWLHVEVDYVNLSMNSLWSPVIVEFDEVKYCVSSDNQVKVMF